MEEQLVGIDRLAEPRQEPVRLFASRLGELWGEHLLALAILGADAAGSSETAHLPLRTAVILERIELDRLWRLAQEGLRFGRERIAAPLVFTPANLRASCDTFPLELIEIQQQQVTVLGDNYFEPLQFQDNHVRLQCERELKVIVIGMHQGLLASAGDKRRLAPLSADLVEHIVRTLRGLLWLRGQREARSSAQVVQAIEKLRGQPLPGVRGLLAGKPRVPWDAFQSLYGDVRALGEFVDGG